MADSSDFGGPHGRIAGDDPRETFLAELLDRLWAGYRDRVPHVRTYENVVREHGGRFVNDHIAFRTLAAQQPPTGIHAIARPFEALGYVAAGCYEFPDKHLSAIHYRHPNAGFPKLFVSQLKTWELSADARRIVAETVRDHRAPLPLEDLAILSSMPGDAPERDRLLRDLVAEFERLPWPLPQRGDVERLNEESQYGAWVLVHGHAVNHFTASIDSHDVAALDDIEKTVAVLEAAGVPMKPEIEGERGSKLRQTATAAATVDVPVRDGDGETVMPWTYAYFELAERGTVTDPETGEQVRFEGFLGPQATQLFEMTRKG